MALDDAVLLCKQMAIELRDAHIRLIRMGLHPGEQLQKEGLILAGPFHPAFGELVKSELALDLLNFVIGLLDSKKKDTITIEVPAKDASIFIGQKKKNLISLSSIFPKLHVKIISTCFLNKIKIISKEDNRELVIQYFDGFKPNSIVKN